ncbi:metallophosphoesterase [Paucilactobacillus hokkaidonensis JCM 18461]|uniref:Metallophosphoesterase n=2 Tax=Paucilactobacillus hokkaidonensis TaxID=1193095 RepID=A0A0A1GSZ2_9LACO|nr:DNA repair exonuclease [Paucilactobacillus hokkaidonensis]KRO09252.1 metallophosphoesterase [Paucilactobacillus hokkaidonensis]BAP85417.1 metallophosphoesterase [Paucilactobacillus hokkaidonensis JCM 18461]
MKFIHTADLHLDSPFLGLQDAPEDLWQSIQQSTFTSFERIVDDALKFKIDFICIAGDIFDRDQRSIAAENFFVRQCSRLQDANIDVYLSYGNHDYQMVTDETKVLPANVHVFGNQVETKTLKLADKTTVAISGFSYGSRWIDDDQTSEYPIKANVDWQIGMLHGALTGLKNPHDNYAPFTVQELLDKNYDYWALGHIHKRQILHRNPIIAYCGNAQGRHRNEAGPKGYYLVTEENQQLVPEFHETAPIDWQTISLELEETDSAAELVTSLQRQVELQVNDTKLTLVSIQLTGSEKLTDELIVQLDNGSILARLQSQIKDTATLKFWPYEAKIRVSVDQPSFTSLDQHYWDEAAQTVFTHENITQLAEKLFQHSFIADQFSQPQTLTDLQQAVTMALQTTQNQEEQQDEDSANSN